jgi:hypothetical protein
MPTLNTLGAVLERLRLDERRDRRARRRLRDRRPKHLRPRRAKVFGIGRVTSLDGNAKARIECRMRVLMRRAERDGAYATSGIGAILAALPAKAFQRPFLALVFAAGERRTARRRKPR